MPRIELPQRLSNTYWWLGTGQDIGLFNINMGLWVTDSFIHQGYNSFVICSGGLQWYHSGQHTGQWTRKVFQSLAKSHIVHNK